MKNEASLFCCSDIYFQQCSRKQEVTGIILDVFLFRDENICCYPLLNRLGETILMRGHNI